MIYQTELDAEHFVDYRRLNSSAKSMLTSAFVLACCGYTVFLLGPSLVNFLVIAADFVLNSDAETMSSLWPYLAVGAALIPVSFVMIFWCTRSVMRIVVPSVRLEYEREQLRERNIIGGRTYTLGDRDITMKAAHKEQSWAWASFDKVVETDLSFHLMSSKAQDIILPKKPKQTAREAQAVRDFLHTKIGH
jgi:hypothetical protein